MRRVLVIDDDCMVRCEVQQALTKDGFEVIEAAKAEEGIRLAQSERFDLVMLDIVMPGMDGISVLRQLRNNPATNKIPVIMVTSLGAEDQIAACLEEGAVDHITKPFSHRLLCTRAAAAMSPDKMPTMAESEVAEPAHDSRVVAFLGAKGGVGTTTIAANAASAAATTTSTVLCELRPTWGTLSLQLNTQPRDHLGTLMNAMSGMTNIAWDCYFVRDSNGLRILFGPQIADREIEIDAARAERVISGLRKQASMVFLDLATGLTNLNRHIVDYCDDVVLVSDCEPTSLAATNEILGELQQTATRHSLKAIGVRRTEVPRPMKIEELSELLNCDFLGVVPPGVEAMMRAAKTGATLVTLNPNDLVATTIRRITEEQFLARSDEPAVVGSI